MKKVYLKKGKISEIIDDIRNKRWKQDRCYIEHLKKEKQDLINNYETILERANNRIVSAIGYINNHFEDSEGIICKMIDDYSCEVNYDFLNDLLNILQGSDK